MFANYLIGLLFVWCRIYLQKGTPCQTWGIKAETLQRKISCDRIKAAAGNKKLQEDSKMNDHGLLHGMHECS